MSRSAAFLLALEHRARGEEFRQALQARSGAAGTSAPSLADPEAFRAALDTLGLNQNTAAGPLGLLPRQVRRYCSRNPHDHRKPPRTLEILIALFLSLQ